MKALRYLGMLIFFAGCACDERALSEVAEAEAFWRKFVESYEGGYASKLFDCFEAPHSEKVKAYVNANSAMIIFARELYARFGNQGLDKFNRHDVFAGDMLSINSSFSRYEPKVVGGSRNGFVLDHIGWRLEVEMFADGAYRIVNSEEALKRFSMEHLEKKFEAYSHGNQRIGNSLILLNEVSELRDEIFDIFIAEAQKDFARSLFE